MALHLPLAAVCLLLFQVAAFQRQGEVLIHDDATVDVKGDEDDASLSRGARSDDLGSAEVVLQQHSEAIAALQAEVSALKEQTDALANVVVYTAWASGNTHPHQGDTVIFSHVLADVGHAYDVSSGIFHVTVTGLYSVFLRSDSAGDTGLRLWLMVDEVEVLQVYGERGPEGVGSHLVLQAGSRLRVKYVSGNAIESATLLSVALIKPE